jgi:hypothetical protein
MKIPDVVCNCTPGAVTHHPACAAYNSGYVWFAAFGGERFGPFASQHEASKAVLNSYGMPQPGAFVWPVLRNEWTDRATSKAPKTPK